MVPIIFTRAGAMYALVNPDLPQGIGQCDAKLQRLGAGAVILNLHKHAGHELVIGHPPRDRPANKTVLWCDTCDELVVGMIDLVSCTEDHWMPDHPRDRRSDVYDPNENRS
jgi:hypothetical protein